MRRNKKIIAIVVATIVLAIAATTGIVMYLNDDGTASAGFEGNDPSVSQGNETNPGTENNNEQDPSTNPDENLNAPGEDNPGSLPEAGDDETQTGETSTTPGTQTGETTTSGTTGNAGTTTSTNNANVPNQEYVTERIEEVERQITEDLLVGWTPISITSAYSTSGLGIYKPELQTAKIAVTEGNREYVFAEESIVYGIAVQNVGNDDITGINVSDIIPEQTTLVENSMYIYANETYNQAGNYNEILNKLSWKIDVKAGEVVVVGFAVLVDKEATGDIKNRAIVNGNETNEIVNPVIEASKTSKVLRSTGTEYKEIEEPANVGDRIEYTVSVTNTGTIPTTLIMQDTVPANTKLVSDIVLANEIIDEMVMTEGKEVTVPAGETLTLTFTVEVEKVEGIIENTAKVGDSTQTNEVKTANLEIAKTVSIALDREYAENVTLGANETAYFKIELTNTGSETLELEVLDVMEGETITLYDGEEAVTDIVTVEAGETKVLLGEYLMKQTDIDAQKTITNTVTVSEINEKVPNDEDTATITTEQAAPSLFIEKTTTSITPVGETGPQEVTDNTRVRPNDVITYTIYVKNDGNVTLYNVDITDSLKVKYGETTVEPTEIIATIDVLEPNADKTYTVEYTVTQADIDNGADITNTAYATDGTLEVEDKTDKDIPTNPDVAISGTKTWIDYNNQENTRPDSIVVKVMNDNTQVIDEEGNPVQTTVEGPNWTYEFSNLPKYDANNAVIEYTVVETAVEEGELDEYTPDYTDRTVAESGNTTANIINTLNWEPTVTVSGTKTWFDYENQEETRPDSIVVKVMNGNEQAKDTKGNLVQVAVEGPSWTYTFSNLPKYDENDAVIEYTVIETAVEEGELDEYTPDYTDKIVVENGDITANITNTLNSEPTVTVSGTKTWYDYKNQEKTRPASKIVVEVVKIINEETTLVESIDVKPDTNGVWSYTSQELPKYDENNNEIYYTVREQEVIGYTPDEVDRTVAENGNVTANITNRLNTVPTVTVSGTKTWNDYLNQEETRPDSIIVKVMNGNEPARDTAGNLAQTTVKGPNWTYAFANLPKYDASDARIEYTVVEMAVANGELDEYTPDYSDIRTATNGNITANISNTLNRVPTVTVTGTKTWNDYNNEGTTRPNNIVVKVMNGTEQARDTAGNLAQAKVEGPNWTYSISNLPKYASNNTVINYTVQEEVVPGYNPSYPNTTKTANGDIITANITNKLIDYTINTVNVEETSTTTTNKNVYIVLDVSSSMNRTIGSQTKIDIATNAVAGLIDDIFTLSNNSQVKMITFNTWDNTYEATCNLKSNEGPIGTKEYATVTTKAQADNLTARLRKINKVYVIKKAWYYTSFGTNMYGALSLVNSKIPTPTTTAEKEGNIVIFVGDGAPTKNGNYPGDYVLFKTNADGSLSVDPAGETGIFDQGSLIRNKVSRFFTLGFALEGLEPTKTEPYNEQQAETILKNIGTTNGDYFDISNAAAFETTFAKIFKAINTKKFDSKNPK